MDKLKKIVLSSGSTPEITLDPEGFIRIKGRSMNGNAAGFYQPVENWIDSFVANPPDITCVDFCLEYFNGIHSMVFISLLRKISHVSLKNKKFIVNWYYEEGDEDILEQGEYISAVLNIPFNFIETDDLSDTGYGSSKKDCHHHIEY